MRAVTIVGLLAIFTIVSFGQSSVRIEGKLIQRSGFPLPNFYFKNLDEIKATYQKVSVTLLMRPDNRKIAETKTNDDGEFTFENIAAGEAIRRSHASARSRAPPKHTPLTAAIADSSEIFRISLCPR